MLQGTADGHTIAHETMHELYGMQDIFSVSEKDDPPQLSVQGTISYDRMPLDWGTASPNMNYYDVEMQSQWIRRLLMHYNDEYSAVGIPRGNVYGVYYHWQGGEKVWSEGMTNVGLFNPLISP